MKDIAIYGAGGFGREVLTLLQDINKQSPQWNFVGFFDDGMEKGSTVNGHKLLGGMTELNAWDTPLSLAIAVGTPTIHETILKKICNPQISFPTLIHPTAIIGDSNFVKIGEGCIICAYNVITTNVEIGDFVILNIACTTGHDTIIHNHASFMPTCNISGEVIIGEGVYCGTGVKIINRTSIGEWSIVGAGAVVTKPLPASCTAVGVPARPIKFHDR